MNTLLQDLRYGVRLLARRPGFTAIILLTLSLGIGANTAIFSVVDAVLLRPLPYPEAERLVFLWSTMTSQGIAGSGSSMPDYRAWRDESRSFEALAGFYYGDFNLTSSGHDPERVQGAYITHNLFAALRVSPAIGRLFTPEEDVWGRHRVVLISDGLWRRRFGGEREIIGREIRLGGESFTIAGVMPAGLVFFDNTPEVDLWTPIAFAPGDSMDTRGNHFVNLVGRLKDGVTIEQAQEDVSAIARRMEAEITENKGLGALLVPVQEQLTGDARRPLYLLLGAVLFVLLLSCVNVANLLLARGAAREREMAIRASLGASRVRIIRQTTTECLPMALLGGALGVLFSLWAIDLLSSVLPAELPRYNQIGLNSRVLAFTFATALATVFLFGLLPALQAARSDVRAALNEGGRTGAGGRRQGRLRRWLVASEIAMALILAVGAGLMARSFIKLRQADLGFTERAVLTLRVPLPDAKYPIPINASDPQSPAGLGFAEQLLERLEALPGVEAASAATMLPLGAGTSWGKGFSIEGRPAPSSLAQVPVVRFALASHDYFRTFGIPVKRGRSFTPGDKEDSVPVAIINETAAKRFFAGEDPVGRTIWMGPPEHLLPPEAQRPDNRFPRRVVVGVVADVKGGNVNQPAPAMVYAPLHQYRREGWSNSLMLAVRTDGLPEAMTAAIREQVRSLDPDQPVTSVRTVEALLARSLSATRFSLLLFGLFAVTALALAAVGVYGVMAYGVEQRTAEIGVRMALGAQRGDVLKLVLGQGIRMAAAGIAAGLAASFALARFVESQLFGISAYDPAAFILTVGLLLVVAMGACYLPARRATRIDPMSALRCE